MMTILKALFLLTSPPVTISNIDMCSLNLDHLNLQQKMQYSIGCSHVNGRRVYNDRGLEKIYGEKRLAEFSLEN